MHSPVEILTSNSGVARAVKLEINKQVLCVVLCWPACMHSHTQNDRSVLYKEIASSLIITSIGFRSIPIDPSIPTAPSTGIILNSRGRVVDTDGKVCPGEVKTVLKGSCDPSTAGFYCTGWAEKRSCGCIF